MDSQKLYILINFGFIQLFESEPLQKLFPKIREMYIIIFDVFKHLLLTHLPTQILRNELEMRLQIDYDGSEIQIVIGLVCEEIKWKFISVSAD